MNKEDKVLLIKDLCARIPYAVKVELTNGFRGVLHNIEVIHLYNDDIETDYVDDYFASIDFFGDNDKFDIEGIKPYLFPLSSMTEEQKKEISKRYKLHTYYGLYIEITNHSEGYWDDDNSCNLQDYLWLVDWFNKNHFDYRGLIEKGLAIDATGLNIY